MSTQTNPISQFILVFVGAYAEPTLPAGMLECLRKITADELIELMEELSCKLEQLGRRAQANLIQLTELGLEISFAQCLTRGMKRRLLLMMSDGDHCAEAHQSIVLRLTLAYEELGRSARDLLSLMQAMDNEIQVRLIH